jgi:acyl-CoA reductase-like NAD-dependent aldehyde dehydrogenase
MSISIPNRPNGAPATSEGVSEGLPQYVQDFVREPRRLLIDGEWVEAASGKTFETLNGGRTGELGYFVQPTVLTDTTPAVWINSYSVFDAAMPFAGYKESGWGREMGHNAQENYLETKSVVTQLA